MAGTELMQERRAGKLEATSASAFAALVSRVESDYAEGRVVVLSDGWIVSKTEARVFGKGALQETKSYPEGATRSPSATPGST